MGCLSVPRTTGRFFLFFVFAALLLLFGLDRKFEPRGTDSLHFL